MDKLNNSEDAKRLLQGLGLHIDEAVVRQVVNVLSGKAHQSLYSLYATRPDKPAPVCAKGSVYKIKKLYDEGELKPYLAYLSHCPTVDEARHEQIKEAEQEAPREAGIEPERYKETARLSIDFDPERSEDQGIFGFVDGGQARFCRVRVYNRGGMTAQKCAGKLMILPPHDKNRLTMYNLHWVFDDPYLPTDLVRPIDILPKDYRPLDVAFALPPSQKDVSKTVSGQTTTSGRIFAISVPGDTKSSQPFEAKLKGCWIATRLALVTHKDDQYHLSPGEYFVKVEVHYSGVEVEAKCFKIISPSDWHNLKMELVECPQAAE